MVYGFRNVPPNNSSRDAPLKRVTGIKNEICSATKQMMEYEKPQRYGELYYHDRTILHIQCPKHKMTSKCCRMIFPFYSACITQQTEMIRKETSKLLDVYNLLEYAIFYG